MPRHDGLLRPIEDNDGDDDPERCKDCGCFICICNEQELDADDENGDDWYGGSISLWDPPNDEEDET